MACEHCHGHHEHSHGEIKQSEEEVVKKKKKRKINFILYIISIVIFALGFLPALNEYRLYVYLLSAILSGYDLIIGGIKNIFKLNFEEDTLMTIAVIAAFAIGEYPESCMVILLYKLGQFIEEKSIETSDKNIDSIVKIQVKTANLLVGNDKKPKVVDVKEIKKEDKILIKPGEIVPVDCIVLEGKSSIDMSNITGESALVDVQKEEELLSGSINLTGSLICIVKNDYANSTATQIVDLVYQASNNKGKTEAFITKFSRIYTPIVVVLSILIAVVPMLLGYDFKEWLNRALVFLVASCPCSIIIATPLAFFSSVGAISKMGMVIKGTKHIENLSKAKIVAFDKTGTITTGKMKVEKLEILNDFEKKDVTSYLISLENNSNHPIAKAIKEIDKDIVLLEVTKYEEIHGHGIYGKVDGKEVLFGNQKLLDKYKVKYADIVQGASYIVIDQKIAGYVVFTEEIRSKVEKMVPTYNEVRISDLVMLTGDHKKNAETIASKVGMKQVYAQLLPKEKLEKIEELKKQGKTIFVGDGINDGPVLAAADFGISMGEGTQIASDIADGVLISNNIRMIPNMIKVARKAMNIIWFNIVFSLVCKIIVLTLGILGYAPIWLAILADTGVTVLTILNSLRIFRQKNKNRK